MSEIKKYKQGNLESERFSEAVQDFILSNNFFINNGAFLTEINSEGVETQFISLSTTVKVLPHRLTRRYNGFLVVEKTAAQHIFNTRSDDLDFINLTASGNVLARVWVY